VTHDFIAYNLVVLAVLVNSVCQTGKGCSGLIREVGKHQQLNGEQQYLGVGLSVLRGNVSHDENSTSAKNLRGFENLRGLDAMSTFHRSSEMPKPGLLIYE
jgi:hypothetical protein